MYRTRMDCSCETARTLVPAGGVCEAACAAAGETPDAGLARIIFPDQQYTYGFCPDEALASGTLFPELVNAG